MSQKEKKQNKKKKSSLKNSDSLLDGLDIPEENQLVQETELASKENQLVQENSVPEEEIEQFGQEELILEEEMEQLDISEEELSPEEEMEQLYQKILYYQDKYYNEAVSEISDFEYDTLYKRLENLESKYPQYKKDDSPTNRVAPQPTSNLKKQKHFVPMLSIENIFSDFGQPAPLQHTLTDLKKFESDIIEKAQEENIDFVVEQKIDGSAVSVWYIHGKYHKAVTRGNGQIGEVITEQVKMIQSLPLQLQGKNIPPILEIRGEVYMTYETFDALNKELEEKNEKLFANPRNTATGTLKLLDLEVVRYRNLSYFAHSIGFSCFAVSYEEIWNKLHLWGIVSKSTIEYATSSSDILNIWKHWNEENFPFVLEGIRIQWNHFQWKTKKEDKKNAFDFVYENDEWRTPYVLYRSEITESNLNEFLDKRKQEISNQVPATIHAEKFLDFCIIPKIKGCSVKIIYEHGVFTKAFFNSDNKQDSTHLFSHLEKIISIPKKLNKKNVPSILEVIGDVYIEQQMEKELFLEEQDLAEHLQQECVPTPSLALGFLVHSIGFSSFTSTHDEMLKIFEEWSLPVNKNRWIVKTAEDMYKIGIQEEEKRSATRLQKKHYAPFPIDGLVFKLNQLQLQIQMGATSHAPKWVKAYKFQPEQADTILQSVSVQVGKLGTLTPVANLEPVFLDDTTVKRATLHNYSYLKDKNKFPEGVCIGDTVTVIKAGDIIPQVIQVQLQKRPKNAVMVQPPTNCPMCSALIVTEILEILEKERLYCPNPECLGSFQAKLEYFVSRQAMNIENMGKSVIEQLIAKNFVKTFADIYKLQKQDLLQLEFFAEKKANKLLESIEKSKNREFHHVLCALSIPNIGKEYALKLANRFKNIENLKNATIKELMQEMTESVKKVAISKVTREKAQKIFNYFHNENFQIPKEQDKEKLHSMIIQDFYSKETSELDSLLQKVLTYYDNIEALQQADVEELSYIISNQGQLAKNIYQFFHSDYGIKIIESLQDVGLCMQSKEYSTPQTNTFLMNKKVVVTGTLPNFTRLQMYEVLRKLGVQIVESVSKKTDYVLVGDNPGSKAEKARQLGIKILNQNDILNEINQKKE